MAAPQRIGDILADLMARRGFARLQATELFAEAWREAAGPLAAEYTQVGVLRRGTLEVTVQNSTLVQELVFQRPSLLKTLARLLPDEQIQDIRFRVGIVS